MDFRPVILGTLVATPAAMGEVAEPADSPEPLVTVSLSRDRLGDVLERLGKEYGYTFLHSSELSGELRSTQVYVASAPASRAFAIVAAAYGACARTMEKIVLLRPCLQLMRLDPEEEPMQVRLDVVIEDIDADASPNGSAGVQVADVFEGGSASNAGLAAGDVIVSYNGVFVTDSRQLRRLVGDTQPGSRIPLEILRGSERLELTAQF